MATQQAGQKAARGDPFELLSDKQRLYVEARLNGLVPYAAARAAGYSVEGSNAYKVEKNPKVRYVLDRVAKQALDKLALKRTDVIEGLLDAVRTAATSAELTGAWRELGKVIGAYEPEKTVLEVRNVTAEKLLGMSDSELGRLAGMDFTLDGPNGVLEGEYEVLSESFKPKALPKDTDGGCKA